VAMIPPVWIPPISSKHLLLVWLVWSQWLYLYAYLSAPFFWWLDLIFSYWYLKDQFWVTMAEASKFLGSSFIIVRRMDSWWINT
jgi:hypothetical protein